MTEHLSESLIGTQVDAWCNTCKRFTKHRVDRVGVDSHAGKPGPCLEHAAPPLSKKQEKARAAREKKEQQKDLF